MRNKKIYILVLALVLLVNIFSVQDSFAAPHKLENIDINVFINADGSARIRETRIADLSEGTENFIVIGSLGESTIKDFVVEEDGRTYEYVNNWDIDASREEKRYKNGIIDTRDGYELSWGIGDYGRHEYIVSYTITDFIKELRDAQILFWRFVNDDLNTPPEEMTITIESEKPFTQGEEEIYAFGYKGDIQFVNGKVVAKSSQALSSSNYATVLVKLPEGMFATGDFIDRDFEDVKDQALEGSDYGKEEESRSSPFSMIGQFFSRIFPFLITVFIGLNLLGRKGLNKGPRTFKRKFKEEYYRDYPYEGDMIDTYHILYNMGVGNFENLLTSFILKWINEERIETQVEESGIIRKKETTNIVFRNRSMDNTSLEGQLFNMMVDAAGNNDILEEKEFTSWATRNRNQIESWEEDVKKESARKLEQEGYLTVEEKKRFIFTTHDIVLTPKGQELEENIYKYINYLHDFSLLNENEAVNVKIWDNIMIWAAALGLTEVVRKQFEKLYPRYEAETVYRGNSIYLAHALTRNVAQAAIPPRSSGGGGFSSSGGGGGSFGGGSGGGTR